MANAPVVDAPALGFSFKIILDKQAQRELVFQTHVDASTPVEEINVMLDKIAKAADRQMAIYELREVRLAMADHKIKLHGLLTQRELLDEAEKQRYEAQPNARGPWSVERLPAQVRQQRQALNQGIEKWREGLERCKVDIERLEPLVNGDAANLSADRHAGVSDS
jgi:hypothetical protein